MLDLSAFSALVRSAGEEGSLDSVFLEPLSDEFSDSEELTGDDSSLSIPYTGFLQLVEQNRPLSALGGWNNLQFLYTACPFTS